MSQERKKKRKRMDEEKVWRYDVKIKIEQIERRNNELNKMR
jgi:hypothetical protein